MSADPYFYLSELFVAAAVRERRIADALLRDHFASARRLGYTQAVLRTSVDQHIIRSIFDRLGFNVVATQEVESTKLINGQPTVVADRRIILAGVIP